MLFIRLAYEAARACWARARSSWPRSAEATRAADRAKLARRLQAADNEAGPLGGVLRALLRRSESEGKADDEASAAAVDALDRELGHAATIRRMVGEGPLDPA